jgi:hypothetical protein
MLFRCVLEPLTGRFSTFDQYMAPALELLRSVGANQLEGLAWIYFACGHNLAGRHHEALRCT